MKFISLYQHEHGGLVIIFKMPAMKKSEYDMLIDEEYI